MTEIHCIKYVVFMLFRMTMFKESALNFELYKFLNTKTLLPILNSPSIICCIGYVFTMIITLEETFHHYVNETS